MRLTTKHEFVRWASCGAALCVAASFGVALTGCAFLYPERSTPLRGVVPEDRYRPPPPKDILYVSIKSARIPPKTRDGRSWDKMGGAAPDAYAVLFVENQEVLRTVTVPNSLKPEWSASHPFNLRIPESAKVRLEMWDDNALVSHPICNQGIRDIQDVASVGQTEIECDSGATVTLVVRPPKARLGIGLYYEPRGKEAVVTRVIGASAAGRAGLKAGDAILSVGGRALKDLQTGELESILSSQSSAGFIVEVRASDGQVRKVELRDEPIYPVKGEGIEFAVD